MPRRAICGSALVLILAPAAAGAVGLRETQPPYTAAPATGPAGRGLGVRTFRAHYRPVFLGCVYSYHECEHLAHDHGYYNHFTRHDHATCHHGPSYACYGQ